MHPRHRATCVKLEPQVHWISNSQEVLGNWSKGKCTSVVKKGTPTIVGVQFLASVSSKTQKGCLKKKNRPIWAHLQPKSSARPLHALESNRESKNGTFQTIPSAAFISAQRSMPLSQLLGTFFSLCIQLANPQGTPTIM